EVALPDPDLGPVDRGHLDDGLDPVDVEPEGDEELEGVGVASRGAEGFGESAESRADVSDTVVAFRLRALGARLGDVAEQRDREDGPPDGDADEGPPRRDAGVGEAEEFGPLDHDQVDEEEQPATEVPD